MRNNKKLLQADLFRYQRHGVNKMIKQFNGKALLADDMGLGKAQSLDCKIYTPLGYTLMNDIKVGQTVCTPNNKTAKIVGVYPQGKKEMYLVTFNDGSSTKCCKEHLWSIRTAKARREDYPTRIKELQDFKDDLQWKHGNKWFIPETGIVNFNSQLINLSPYLLGTLIGDGSMTHGLTLTSSYECLIEQVNLDLEKNHPKIKLNQIGDSISYRVINKIKTRNNEIRRELSELNLYGCKSKEKFIPKKYLYNTFKIRQALLQGLIDTDGEITKQGGIRYSTASKQLALDVQELVNTLGGFARLNTKTGIKNYEDNIYYQLTINLPEEIIPARSSRRLERYNMRKRKYNPVRAFKSVEYIGKEECQCIMIDSEDHLYLTDYCIATHNTISSISLISRYAGKMAVVACPNFLKYNWVEEFRKFLPSEELYICQGQKPKSLKGFKGTVIINYEILNHWKDAFIKAGVEIFVCDESQYLKNKSKRTKAAIKISKKCEIKILLSGTPIENHPADLYWQLQIIRPDLYTSYLKFIKRYNSAVKTARFGWQMGRAVNMKELNATLLRECMIRRTKEEVLPDLPDKIRSVIPLEIDNRKEYKDAEKNIISWVRKNTTLSVDKAKKCEQLTKLDKLLQIAARGKIKQVLEWVENESEKTKLVIFCRHKGILNELEKKLKNSVSIRSEQKPEERQLIKNRFQKDDRIRTLLTTIRVGGTGLTLHASSTTVFIQLDWNSARHDQAEDRINRIGQKASSIRAIYFIARDTIEEKVMKLIDARRATAGKAIDGIDVDENDLLIELLKGFKNG